MQQHYHATTNSIGPLPPRVGMITNFPLASAETHRAHGYHPVAEVVYVEGAAPSVAYDYETQVATVTRVPEPEPPNRADELLADEPLLTAICRIIELWHGLQLPFPESWFDALLIMESYQETIAHDALAMTQALAAVAKLTTWERLLREEFGGAWSDVLLVAGLLSAPEPPSSETANLWTALQGA